MNDDAHDARSFLLLRGILIALAVRANQRRPIIHELLIHSGVTASRPVHRRKPVWPIPGQYDNRRSHSAAFSTSQSEKFG